MLHSSCCLTSDKVRGAEEVIGVPLILSKTSGAMKPATDTEPVSGGHDDDMRKEIER
jgi:hypothetical protein